MNKKLITVILALVLTMTIGLAACGGSGETNARQITVSYMIDGAEHSKETINEGSTPNLPTPTKDGYTFEKWHLDEWYETEYTEDAFKALEVPEDNTIKLYGRYNKNALTFDEAVAAYKAGKPLYLSYSLTMFNVTGTVEMYLGEKEVALSQSAEGITQAMYGDLVAANRYFVDAAKKRLVQTSEFISTQYVYFGITGNGTNKTVTIDSKDYEACEYALVGSETYTVSFIKEDNKVTKLYITRGESQVYEDVVISTEIPTTSNLYSVSKYTKSDSYAYVPYGENLYPTLVSGKVYYFEPIGDKTLAVNDVVLLADAGGYFDYRAGIITEISSSGATPYSVKLDDGDTESFSANNIKYILEK